VARGKSRATLRRGVRGGSKGGGPNEKGVTIEGGWRERGEGAKGESGGRGGGERRENQGGEGWWRVG